MRQTSRPYNYISHYLLELERIWPHVQTQGSRLDCFPQMPCLYLGGVYSLGASKVERICAQIHCCMARTGTGCSTWGRSWLARQRIWSVNRESLPASCSVFIMLTAHGTSAGAVENLFKQIFLIFMSPSNSTHIGLELFNLKICDI